MKKGLRPIPLKVNAIEILRRTALTKKGLRQLQVGGLRFQLHFKAGSESLGKAPKASRGDGAARRVPEQALVQPEDGVVSRIRQVRPPFPEQRPAK